MSTTIRIKKSGITSNTPGALEFGELAINYADGRLFYKDATGNIQQFTSGSGVNSFETVNANGSLLIADSNTDILNINAGTGIDISGNTINDTFTIAARLDNTVTSTSITSAATSAAVNAVYTVTTNAYGQANNAYGQANNAYGQANNAYTQANNAYGQANNAYTQANNAYGQANNAYAQANSNYQPAVTRLDVTNNGASAYQFDQYGAAVNNPTLYVRAGESLAFSLNVTGHPFQIRVSSGGANFDTGLTHVSTTGVVSTNSSAQGKVSGTLYWKVPYELQGNTYVYQCAVHGGMVGNIVIEQPVVVAHAQANAAYAQANAAYGQANAAYGQANNAYIQANNAYAKANAPITVKEVHVSNSTVVNTFTNINTLQFDADSGMAVVNAASNTVTIQLNSTFKNWLVNGNTGLVATGLDTVNFVPGSGITIEANNNASPKTITFSSTGGGGSSISNIRVSQNSTSTINANAFNFVNSSTVTISVTPGVNGNANITFTSAGGGSGSSNVSNTIITRNQFTGNGSCTVFTLSATPETTAHVLVFVDKVFQLANAYTLNGSQLQFTGAPDNGSSIETYVYGAAGGSAIITTDVYTANGAQTSFTLSQPSKATRTLVFIDGVSQRPNTDFQVNSTTLTMNVAPANNSIVEVRGFSLFNTVDINVAPVTLTSDKLTGTGACTIFSLSQSGTTDSSFVFINGVAQKPATDYSVSSNVITFSTAPANGSIVEVRTVGNFKVIEPESRIDSDTFTGTGACTSFTITNFVSTKKAFVYIDGVAQKPFSDYTVSGQTLLFTEAPPSNSSIEVRTFAPFAVADLARTLSVYARDTVLNIPLRLGAPATLTVVGRSTNTSVGVA